MKLYEILLRKIGLWEDPQTIRTETTIQTTVTSTSRPTATSPKKAQEDLIYNPIGVKVGGVVKVDSLDFRNHRFTVREILEYIVTVDGNKTKMVDYVLLARPIDQPDFNCRLRIVPDLNSRSKTTHRALLMTVYDKIGYDQVFVDEVLNAESKDFKITNDDDPQNITEEMFWRVNDVGISYSSKVKSLVDADGSGKVDSNEVTSQDVEFWDYSRNTTIEGVEVEEFVFVEMNKTDGQFTIWRGSEVDPERIDVF